MTTALRRAAHWHRPLMLLTSAMAVLTVVAAVGVFTDPRILTGVPIWLKPLKFAVSFGLYGVTLAWMLSQLRRRSRVAEWSATVIVAMSLAELVVIVVQVLRGTTSHYNGTTPFDTVMWQVMGASIMVLFGAHVVIGVALLFRPVRDRATRVAVGLGIGLSSLGMLVAIPMVRASQAPAVEGITGAHSVGVPDGGPGLPLVGWSTTGGDLRIGHFVGLHALQVLPILAILLQRLGTRLDERTRVRLLVVAGAAYGVLTMLLTWQALRGQPLLRPDPATLGAVAALVAATATAAGVVVAHRRRPELVLAA
ncbi:hypothetical protein GA0070616_0379 [Micromonospora nigra]|uniref:Uncharacterized protein n=1 Tax=Micromonospora nigra TaxID=145857 RepID=A0A1C6RAV3_9ACTN|nr:hypothetical protein [Micromonospora nigra]SCL14223.1 hypothetical protein GA0070616_0379 [Micromonospora nigra]